MDEEVTQFRRRKGDVMKSIAQLEAERDDNLRKRFAWKVFALCVGVIVAGATILWLAR